MGGKKFFCNPTVLLLLSLIILLILLSRIPCRSLRSTQCLLNASAGKRRAWAPSVTARAPATTAVTDPPSNGTTGIQFGSRTNQSL